MPEPSDALDVLLAGQLRAEQHDRRRLADRLHDGPQQVLVSLGIRLQLLQQQLPAEHAGELDVLVGQVESARHALRGLVVDLEAPPDVSLEDGLRWLLETNAAAAGWRTALTVAPGSSVGDIVRLTVQRVVQEVLADVRLHAGAGRVEISVVAADGWLDVTVTDDGAERSEPVTGTGGAGVFASVLDRVGTIGGRAQVERDRDGTLVKLQVPMRPDAG